MCMCKMCAQEKDKRSHHIKCSGCRHARRGSNYNYCNQSGVRISLQSHHGCKFGEKKFLRVDRRKGFQYLPTD